MTFTVITVIGCRPDIIRYVATLNKLDRLPNVKHLIVHTGQHYDDLLSNVFFEELGVRSPDVNLGCGIGSNNHYEQLSKLSVSFPNWLVENNISVNDTIIIFLGDTNSVLASVPIKKMGYKIGRIECFMRSYDDRMLEEINRKVADHVSDLYLCYTEENKLIANKEGVTKNIHVVGNTVLEPFNIIKDRVIIGEKSCNMILIDIHRPENTKYPDRVRMIINLGNKLASEYGVPVKMLYFKSLDNVIKLNNINLGVVEMTGLMGYIDYLKCIYNCVCLISDSGTAQEEACLLTTPCIVPRDYTERPQSYTYNCSMKYDKKTNYLDVINYINGVNDFTIPVDISWLQSPSGEDTSSLIVKHIVDYLWMTKFSRVTDELNEMIKDPYPHMFQDNFITDVVLATKIQEEILSLPLSEFDRYDNPFEQKYTLRDKSRYPPTLQRLIDYFVCDEFIDKLSQVTGHQLLRDDSKNFYGVHVYEPGDKLDIHVDAGLHPDSKLKKQVTLGIYLSYQWSDDCGCELEVWRGDSLDGNNYNSAKLYECVTRIVPRFNRLILFNCDDNSWHGNPNRMTGPETSRRIFVTVSYLSNDKDMYKNHKEKAYFIARPGDPIDEEKDRLRQLRANPETCNQVYRCNKISKKDIEVVNGLNFIYMDTFSELANKYCDFSKLDKVIIFDIGSKDGHAAKFMQSSIPNSVAYGFEAHPVEYNLHKDSCGDINWVNLAIYNYDGKITFHSKEIGSGIHSVRDRGQEFGTDVIEVNCMRMDTYCKQVGVVPNVVKIDVEGCSMEILESFGDLLLEVDIIHIETEEKEYFKGQILEDQVFSYLEKNNFKKIYFTYVPGFWQHDSVWINLSK